MEPGFRYRGSVAAELRWGYRTAARLADWTLATDAAGTLALTATVVEADAFALGQAPLRFVVPSRPAWRWTVLTLRQVDTSVTLTLSQEEQIDESLSVRGPADRATAAVGR